MVTGNSMCCDVCLMMRVMLDDACWCLMMLVMLDDASEHSGCSYVMMLVMLDADIRVAARGVGVPGRPHRGV